MPPHGHYGDTSNVRYDPTTETWSLRCPDCASRDRMCFWPLTLEFWNPNSMQRCRACNSDLKRRKEREASGRRRRARQQQEAA